ncbi:TonB-dependent receptor [Tenacibaculum litopenaei]|uniref:TonB-dependent receptor n=1 Tax=Tenacibaculum litopenaei TaxID=396016 RepID=UPI003894B754
MKKLLFIAFLSLCNLAFSQSKGTVSGVVTDKDMNGEPLPFANVFVKGTSIGGTTDIDGKYSFAVPAGNQTIVFSFVGYQSVEKAVLVKAGETVVVNQEIGASEGVSLDEVKINATVSKEKESALLLEQKKATVIKESIGAQELAKKAVSDAATAATKVAGVTKQEGSNKVYVRGLGDRYNSTTLNGLPLPSNDPRFKNIALELFSTGMIQNIGVSKTFSSSLSGDVAGANIDIVSKEHSGKPAVNVGFSSSVNTQTTGRSFKTIDGANWIGVAKSTQHPVTRLDNLPFTDSFTPENGHAAPTTSLSVSGGKRYTIGEESSLSVFLVGSFGNKYSFRDGVSINFLRNDGSTGNNFTSAKQYAYETSKLMMGSFAYKINENHKVSWNSLFIHSNTQNIQDYYGKKPDVADSDGVFASIILQTENQNNLFVNQLLSEHKLGESIDVSLGLAYNIVANDEPNRKKNMFVVNNNDNTIKFASGAARNNSRYYHNLSEDDFAAKLNFVKYFGTRIRGEHKAKLSLGFDFRKTVRDFRAIYFDYDLAAPTIVDPNNVDAVLNQQNMDNGVFRLKTGFGFGSGALDPFTYDAERMIGAGYASLDYQLTDKLFVNVGARFENVQMDVSWRTNLSSSFRDYGGPKKMKDSYFLPSLNLKYTINDDNLLRLAASKTYTYPQFKEVAPFVYEGIDFQEVGNANLMPSTNYNVDIKYEMYPSKGELISATVFGKMIQDGINRVELPAASDNFFSFYNTGDTKIFGVETEVRKKLYSFAGEDADYEEDLKLGFNATYMHTKQSFNRTAQFNPTNDDEPTEGAAPFLVNTDITYNYKKDNKETLAALVFNYQDDKLFSIGSVNGLQSIYQRSIPRLDFVFKRQFNKRLGLKFSAKNLLNPKIEMYRNVPRKLVTRSFKRGIDLSLGLSYSL